MKEQRSKDGSSGVSLWPQIASQWLPLTLILLLATGLYFYQLDRQSLWIDELLSIDSAQDIDGSLGRFFNNRILYFLLLRGWMSFGESDAWLRSLGIIFALGSIYLTYQLGSRLLSKACGLIGALLVALSPLFIHHAQEVRMYTTSTFLGLLGTLIVSYALENPKMQTVFGWAIARFLAIVTTPLNLFLLLPDIVLIGWKFRSQRLHWWRFILGLILIGILWLPWIVPLAISSSKFMGGASVAGATVGGTVDKSSPGLWAVLSQPLRFTVWPFGRANSALIYWIYILFVWVLAFLLGTALLQVRHARNLGWVAAWALLPAIPLFAVSQVSRSLWVNRYLLFTTPYLFLLFAAGWMYVWKRWHLGAIAIALLYAVTASGGIKRYYSVQDRANWRGLVQAIANEERPKDAIVWSTGQVQPLALEHYYKGSAAIKMAEIPLPCTASSNRQAMQSWLKTLSKDYSRYWLICSLGDDNLPIFEINLSSQFEIENHQIFHGEAGGDLHLFLVSWK